MRTTLIIPDQMHSRLELQSKRSGLSVSEIIRAAIDAHLNHQDTFYEGERLKSPTGLTSSAGEAFGANSIIVKNAAQERQDRIERLAKGGIDREEAGRPSPFSRKPPTP